jgi:hypothetical protein
MASGFVTSAGKDWAGQYNCGDKAGGNYGKPTKAGSKPSKGGKK